MLDDYKPGEHLAVELLGRANELQAQLAECQRQQKAAGGALRTASGWLSAYLNLPGKPTRLTPPNYVVEKIEDALALCAKPHAVQDETHTT